MLSEFEYLTSLVYSPRGNSENALKSKKLLGLCKNGNPKFSDALVSFILKNGLENYFKNAVLIPIPRSSPTVEGSVFPSKVISDTLLKNNIGNGVWTCLKRTKAIPKSSSQYDANSRNSVATHLDSLLVENILIMEPEIVLIDDVFTQGRTAMASAMKIQNMFPDKKIKIFCPFRTKSFEDQNILENIDHGKMLLSPNGKVILPD